MCVCVCIKSNERGDQIFHTATLALFSYKVSFFLVISAFFHKYALPLLKRNVNTNLYFMHKIARWEESALLSDKSALFYHSHTALFLKKCEHYP